VKRAKATPASVPRGKAKPPSVPRGKAKPPSVPRGKAKLASDPPAAPESVRTLKGERTRQRILDAAFALFAQDGYEHTSMRAVAARAGCALGLIYRYFPQREDFALELYRAQSLAAELQVATLPAATLAERFRGAMHGKLVIVAPHLDALRALASGSLDRQSPIAVLGERTAPIRETVERTIRVLVEGATDRPAPPHDEQLVRLLFVVQLFVVLAATQDTTPGLTHAHALVDAISDALASIGPMLPMFAPMLGRFDALLAGFVAAGVQTGADAPASLQTASSPSVRPEYDAAR
jgi:AcrR family transcriptional regulator